MEDSITFERGRMEDSEIIWTFLDLGKTLATANVLFRKHVYKHEHKWKILETRQ